MALPSQDKVKVLLFDNTMHLATRTRANNADVNICQEINVNNACDSGFFRFLKGKV